MKTARLIITFDCNKDCSYCCNKYTSLIKKAMPNTNLDSLVNYDAICITGGEPFLDLDRTLHIVEELAQLKTTNPNLKLYLYTAMFKPLIGIYRIIRLVDGVQYTLHAKSNELDIHHFKMFQTDIASQYPDKSCRLYIHPDVPYEVPIIPSLWKRLEVKPWIKEEDCCLPQNETLYTYLK